MKSKKRKHTCAYCGKCTVSTKDHVIPRNIFPDGYTIKNLRTVCSCKKCNQSYSLDEQYFWAFLLNTSSDTSKWAHSIFETKFKRAIQRKPGLGNKIFNSMELVDSVTPSGIYIGKKTKINISKDDWKRYYNVLDKIIKGFFYIRFNQRVPKNYFIKHSFIQKNHDKYIKYFQFWNKENKEIILHGYGQLKNTFNTIWCTIFYESVMFVSFVRSIKSHQKLNEQRVKKGLNSLDYQS